MMTLPRMFATIALLLAPLSVMAAPFLFTWQGLIGATSLTLTGVNAGDTATVEVIADNGGNTLALQDWYQADVTSATVSVGSYSGTFNFPYFSNDPLFSTDGAGQLIKTVFYDVDDGNTDSLGRSAQLYGDAIVSASDITAEYAYFQIGYSPSIEAQWTVARAPEPGTLALLGLGLAGLAATRRRKQ